MAWLLLDVPKTTAAGLPEFWGDACTHGSKSGAAPPQYDAISLGAPRFSLYRFPALARFVQAVGDSGTGAGNGGPPNSFIVHKEIEVTVRSTPGKSRIRNSSCRSEEGDSTLIFKR